VIKSVDGIAFQTPEEIRLYVFKKNIGDRVEFDVIRNGKELEDPLVAEVIPKRLYNSEFSI
jgi:S1-C subfamily serine protease